jgi:hypothetical protein
METVLASSSRQTIEKSANQIMEIDRIINANIKADEKERLRKKRLAEGDLPSEDSVSSPSDSQKQNKLDALGKVYGDEDGIEDGIDDETLEDYSKAATF